MTLEEITIAYSNLIYYKPKFDESGEITMSKQNSEKEQKPGVVNLEPENLEDDMEEDMEPPQTLASTPGPLEEPYSTKSNEPDGLPLKLAGHDPDSSDYI